MVNKTILIVSIATIATIASYLGLAPRLVQNVSTAMFSDADLKEYAYVQNFYAKVSEFRQWINEHNKTYSALELPAKFKVWSDNYDFVQEENSKGHSYTLGMNHLADLTVEEHTALHLGLIHKNTEADEYNGESEDENVSVPTSVDWRNKGAVGAIRNQGSCGGCWAFATSAALEGLHKISNGKLQTFSPQQLIDCSSSYGNNGCNGGLLESAFKYTRDNGIAADSSYPYQQRQTSCRYSKQSKVFQNRGYKTITQGASNLQSAVANGPVAVAIDASSQSFQLYKSGLFTACGTNLDHAITAVGYSTGGQAYWIVKNQWGTTWGEKGYVKIPLGDQNNRKGTCGINSSATYPTL